MDAIYLFVSVFSLGTYFALWKVHPHERGELAVAGITGAIVMAAMIVMR